jgi:hypothetical protein
MFGKLSLVIVAGLLLSLSARAQSITNKIDGFGGYSYMHFGGGSDFNGFNSNGWELSGEYKVLPWIGAAVDVDGHYGSLQGVSSSVHNYLFGPQVSFPARVSPFAHVLVGGEHFHGGGASDTSFATAFGFGIDTHVAPQISWRIVQFDVIHTHLFNEGEDHTRVSTGIVFHF